MRISRTELFFLSLFLLLITSSLKASELETYSADKALRTREFIVMGYQGLMAEIKGESGPYILTLLDLLTIPAEKKEAATRKIYELSKSTSNIMDFADQVIRYRLDMVMGEKPIGPTIASDGKLENALFHLTRGMKVTVYLKSGEQLKGTFNDYTNRRLFLRGATKKSVSVDEILAIDTSDH
jgi:hypothetical protein